MNRPESDAPADDNVARSRETGGKPDPDAADPSSTTGTTENETFVGRIAGQDDASADDESGAEARAQE